MQPGTRRLTVGLVLVVAVLTVGIGVVQPERPPRRERTAADVRMVTVEDNGTAQLWPYTSRAKRFSAATLPINIVVEEDPATTRRVLAGTAKWSANSPQGEAVVINGTGVTWGETVGADRYTYVETASGGTWKTATYQLHDGHYLGSRTHLRLYEGGGDDETWTAIQGHTEYWDWFRLRHTVGSVADARYDVEQDLYGTGLIADISRERYGNGGALDADGWVTHVDLVDWMVRPGGTTGPADGTGGTASPAAVLAPLVLGVGMALAGRVPPWERLARSATESRMTPFHVGLVVATSMALPAIRLAGVFLEGVLPGVSPKLIAAPLYLCLAAGLPAAAAVLGARIAADDGFVVAFLGGATGFVLDYAIVGVAVPVPVLVQRGVLLVALGLLAAGGTRWSGNPLQRHRYRVPGAVLWVAGLGWPLLDLV